jgi:hypothetical protein
LTDWEAWHADYADAGSPLSQRLATVQRHIDEWLTGTAPAEVSVLSFCAGDGRDLLEVLERRSDAERVTATLLETDPRNVARAADHIDHLGSSRIEVRRADAGSTRSCAGAAPADLVLMCGVFGNVSDDDVHRTVAALPQLAALGARVIWTRHRRAPDLTPRIRAWFAESGFDEEHFVAPADGIWSVGVHRFTGTPEPLDDDRRLFTFTR